MRWLSNKSQDGPDKSGAAERLAHSPEYVEALASTYRGFGLEILERGGILYPMAVIGRWHRPLLDEDPALILPGSWETGQEPQELLAYRDESYRKQRQADGGVIEPRETYALDRITLDSPTGPQLLAKIGRYDLGLDTCEALEWEMNKRLTKPEHLQADAMADRLVLRRAAHQAAGNPLLSGQGRSATLGVSMLVTFSDGEDEMAIIARRNSQHVGTSSTQRHVVPAFIFQPMMDRDAEYNLAQAIRREYAEELFGNEAPEDATWHWPRALRTVQYLDSLLLSGGATLRLTGLAMNLMTLRPEICLHLRILSPGWFSDHSRAFVPEVGEHISPGEEYLSQDVTGESPFVIFDPYADETTLVERAKLTAQDTVPMAAAAYWLAIDDVRRQNEG